jgi:hypothetical protein
MSGKAWILAAVVAVIIWKSPAGAGHFVSETWDKAITFVGTVFH